MFCCPHCPVTAARRGWPTGTSNPPHKESPAARSRLVRRARVFDACWPSAHPCCPAGPARHGAPPAGIRSLGPQPRIGCSPARVAAWPCRTTPRARGRQGGPTPAEKRPRVASDDAASGSPRTHMQRSGPTGIQDVHAQPPGSPGADSAPTAVSLQALHPSGNESRKHHRSTLLAPPAS